VVAVFDICCVGKYDFPSASPGACGTCRPNRTRHRLRNYLARPGADLAAQFGIYVKKCVAIVKGM
jgi:hypothetical protein